MPHTLPIVDGWRASPRDERLERTYWQTDLDDTAWRRVTLPHQWAVREGFEDCRGPVAYRAPVRLGALAEGERAFVRANGAFYYSHLWIDDVYLGNEAGYFAPQIAECTTALKAGDEHLLAIEVECPDQHDPSAKTIVTGVFSHWDALDPAFNPGGLWRGVDLVVTGPARLRSCVATPTNVSPAHARVDVRVTIDSAVDASPSVRGTLRLDGVDVAGTDRPVELTRDGTDATATIPIDVAAPELWWPHLLGSQPLYELTVELVGDDGTVWDRSERTVGIRTVSVKDWIFTVNGERLFMRGSNYAPTRMALGDVTAAECEAAIARAKDANLDLLRVHAHVATPDLYEAADRGGMLLWQDFPLQWGYSRRIKRSAVDQARQMVHLLGSHPSVAMWCCHNEPIAVETTDVRSMTPMQFAKVGASLAFPTWNKSVLDPALRHAITSEDPSRFCNEKSGEIPSVTSYGTDSHLYIGWYMNWPWRTLEWIFAFTPRVARFMSEFGAQSLPSAEVVEEMLPGAADAYPDLDWERLRDRHSLQPEIMHGYTPPSAHADLKAYVAATQRYQGEVIRYHVQTLRIRKYAPTGGFCQFQFNDSYPAVTWSVLDHRGEPKSSFDVLAEVCAPVAAFAHWPPREAPAGSPIAVDLWVVSELRGPLRDLRVTASLFRQEHEWAGDVGADSAVRIGTFEADLPYTPGAHDLVVTLRDGDEVLASSTYTITTT